MENFLQEEAQYTTRILKEENRKAKNLTPYILLLAASAATTALGLLAYTLYSRDQEPPRIEELRYSDRIEKGQTQSITVCAREQNPSEKAALTLNGTAISLPLTEKNGDKACYSTTFDPSSYFTREGPVAGQLTLTDKNGNTATREISFLVNLEPPKIADINIQKTGLGKYTITADITDENLKDAYILLDSHKLPLTQQNQKYTTTIETLRDLNFTIIATDKYNMTSSYQGKIEFSKDNPNVAYALQRGLNQTYIYLIAPLDNDRVQDLNEKNFVDLIANNSKILVVPAFSRYLEKQASDGVITGEELKYSSNFASLVNGIYDSIYGAKNVYEDYLYGKFKIKDPLKTIDYSSGLGLRLGFDKELAKDATVKAIAYYGIGVVDRNLPENFDEIFLLTKATQIDKYGDKLVDFSPIVFKSVDGSDFVLIPDAGRETWMLTKHMKLIKDSGFDILKHPEMFEGLNGKIIANAYSIFDAKYGINYIEQTLNNRNLKPTDKDVWDLITLQWNLYSNKAPQLGGENKLYNRDFPWYDSDKLDTLYQDANTRRQALLFLFHLDNGTFDMEKVKTVVGIDGARTALIQAEKEYETISKLYPNGKVKHEIWGNVPAWWYYYDFIEDRGVNGLENTHLQYVGLKPLELWNIMISDPENVWNNIKDLNGVDQYITKNWKYWDLVKFAMGYERWNKSNFPGMYEDYTVNYTIPQTLKAFGFPTYFGGIEPAPIGAGVYEWVVSLPDYIANKLKSEFNDKIAIGSANGFGLYLCKDGLIKDGIRRIFGFSGGTGLLADKQPSLGLGSNFTFYFLKK
jgi:hypothetical protein